MSMMINMDKVGKKTNNEKRKQTHKRTKNHTFDYQAMTSDQNASIQVIQSFSR